MKVAVFINEDYDFMFDMFKGLIPGLMESHQLAGVVRFPGRLTRHTGAGIYKAYLDIFGLGVFLKLALISLLKRLFIFAGYAARKCPFCSFEGMYRHYGITKLNFTDPNDMRLINWVKENDIDVILIFMGQILRGDIIQAPKICVLNKHAGLLPAYRGVFPVFWAMANGDEIGVTIHKVSRRIDDGEIILQKVYGRRYGYSVYDYYKLVYSQASDLMLESLRLVASNERRACKHNMAGSSFSLPTRQDYDKFKKAGYRFV